MRFSQCNELQIIGLKHINSQKIHLTINDCDNASISGLHMIAPQESPNTDGIDIGSSTNLLIKNCTMETGDDCIAIKGGTSNVSISEIACGPGHGIRFGGSGFARNIIFSHINFTAANNPVIIDQFYCPHKTCFNQVSKTSAIFLPFRQIKLT
ncbi:hypothetical protein Pfo_011996 [Paulownia fortunei]|nr:hypothetical protein Pfo_011996 [Paulownia fortunei]